MDVRTPVWIFRDKESGKTFIVKGKREYKRAMEAGHEKIKELWYWAEKLLLVAWDRGEERMRRGWLGTRIEAKRENGHLKIWRSWGLEWDVDVENKRVVKWPEEADSINEDLHWVIENKFGAKNIGVWQGEFMERDIIDYLEKDIWERSRRGRERLCRTFHKHHEEIGEKEIEDRLPDEWDLGKGWSFVIDRFRRRLYLPRGSKIYRLKISEEPWKIVIGNVEVQGIRISAVLLMGRGWMNECPPWLYLAKTNEPLKRWIMDLTPAHEIVEEVG